MTTSLSKDKGSAKPQCGHPHHLLSSGLTFPQSSSSKFMCMYLAEWSLTRLKTVECLGFVNELQQTHRRAPAFLSSTPRGQSRLAWPLLEQLLAAPSASLKSPPGRIAQDIVSPVSGCTLLNPWFAQCLCHRA